MQSLEQTIKFYEAYQALANTVNNKSEQLVLRMEPGNVLFIDNFRVLHGRTAFQVLKDLKPYLHLISTFLG